MPILDIPDPVPFRRNNLSVIPIKHLKGRRNIQLSKLSRGFPHDWDHSEVKIWGIRWLKPTHAAESSACAKSMSSLEDPLSSPSGSSPGCLRKIPQNWGLFYIILPNIYGFYMILWWDTFDTIVDFWMRRLCRPQCMDQYGHFFILFTREHRSPAGQWLGNVSQRWKKWWKAMVRTTSWPYIYHIITITWVNYHDSRCGPKFVCFPNHIHVCRFLNRL